MAQTWHAEPYLHLSSDTWASRRTPNFLARGRPEQSHGMPWAQVATPPRALGTLGLVAVLLSLRGSKARQVARQAGYAQQPRLPRMRSKPDESETRMGTNILLSVIFLFSSGANKVLLRILLVLVSRYAFMLGVLTNVLYIITFGLQFRIELAAAGESDDESRSDSFKFALKNGLGLHLLAVAGSCEAIAFVLLPYFASLLPGSLLPVMSQGLLIFSMFFSWVILGRRYDLLQAGIGKQPSPLAPWMSRSVSVLKLISDFFQAPTLLCLADWIGGQGSSNKVLQVGIVFVMIVQILGPPAILIWSVYAINWSNARLGLGSWEYVPGSYEKGVSNLANQILGTFFSAFRPVEKVFPWEAEGSTFSTAAKGRDFEQREFRREQFWSGGRFGPNEKELARRGCLWRKVSKRNKDKSKFPLLAEAKKDKASSSRDLTEEALLKSIQQTSDPLQAMLAMQIADRLEKNRRRRKSSKSSHSSRSDSSRSSRSHSQERYRQRGHAKAIENYRASRRRMRKRPLKYVKQYVQEVEEELGVDNGKPYNLHDMGRRVSWGKQKSLQRTHYILSEVLTLLKKKYEQATLQTMLGLRAIHQTALDQGDWSLSWLLTHLPNVWDRKQWGGSAEELGNVAAYLRSMEELNKSAERARNAHWAASGSTEINDASVPPRGKGKEKGKSKNKDGEKTET
eukprot:symbB.v1.2.008720.t1/scaffold545.1/size189104/5